MEITVLQCPKCGGDINFKTGDRTVKCPYCDSLLEIKADSAEIALEKAKKEFSDIKRSDRNTQKRQSGGSAALIYTTAWCAC